MTSQTPIKHTDFEVSEMPQRNRSNPIGFHLRFLFAGVIFGILLVKSEVISWFRIQEMFRLQSFHMFGVIGSAVVVGMISVLIIKEFRLRTLDGEPVHFEPRRFHKGNIFGGLIFGFGWALTGACPGPLYAQIGTGALVVIVTLLSAVAGTWLYGYFQSKLPH